MTAKSPSTSSLSSDTPIDAPGDPTFEEIFDSNGVLVGRNTVTFDKNLKASGTTEQGNTELFLRDGGSNLDDVTSSSSGNWVKHFMLTNFKSYGLSVREKEGDRRFSYPAYTIVLATETPIISSVVGKDGPIGNGDTYYGISVDITGNAPPGMEVEALNGDTPLGMPAPVNSAGLFKLTLDELAPATYTLKIKAANGKESDVFTLIVAVGNPLSLDDVIDDKGNNVGEGENTTRATLTIKGKARGMGELLLLGGQPSSVTVPADELGLWEHTFTNLGVGTYSLTAQSIYEPVETTEPPRTFTVALPVELSLDEVIDSDGSVAEGETTYDTSVTVSGRAQPGAVVQLLNNDAPIAGATDTAKEDESWEIILDVTPDTYSLTAEALDEKTSTPRTFTVAVDVELSLDDILESEAGPSVPEDGTTYKDELIVKGRARPGESIQLLNGGAEIPGASATADDTDGAWTVRLKVTEGAYSLAARAEYGEGEVTQPPRTFNVESIIKPHDTKVFDSNGLIENNGSTYYNYVVVRGTAEPSAQIKLKINGVLDQEAAPAIENGRWAKFVTDLTRDTTHEFIAVADYGDNSESEPWTIEVLNPTGG
jgi:hypothetical protein